MLDWSVDSSSKQVAQQFVSSICNTLFTTIFSRTNVYVVQRKTSCIYIYTVTTVEAHKSAVLDSRCDSNQGISFHFQLFPMTN
jgi:hypothetical protein